MPISGLLISSLVYPMAFIRERWGALSIPFLIRSLRMIFFLFFTVILGNKCFNLLNYVNKLYIAALFGCVKWNWRCARSAGNKKLMFLSC
jgi:hypothetical protein